VEEDQVRWGRTQMKKPLKKVTLTFLGGGQNIKLDVTDLAMHYGIENCLFGKSIESDYLSNGIEQLRVGEETPYKWNEKKLCQMSTMRKMRLN
jgi:hypothetical protein